MKKNWKREIKLNSRASAAKHVHFLLIDIDYIKI